MTTRSSRESQFPPTSRSGGKCLFLRNYKQKTEISGSRYKHSITSKISWKSAISAYLKLKISSENNENKSHR